MKDGKELEAESVYPLGEPESPMSKEEAIRKFRRTASYAIDDRRMDQLIERVANLDKEENAAKLTPLLHL
jgi:2-methylcitrate dehydratase PrpD